MVWRKEYLEKLLSYNKWRFLFWQIAGLKKGMRLVGKICASFLINSLELPCILPLEK